MKKVSILHISDIHKNAGVKLGSLLHSLIRDKERWEEEGIRLPGYIVLSGDVIQGGPTDAEIEAQYVEAEAFLSDLCKEFLDNHRERMIIVPGNHDVSWPHSGNCMDLEPITDDSIKLYREHKHPLRWDWDGRQLYKIKGDGSYAHRFDKFIEFYNRFFDGIRAYPANPEMGATCIAFDNDYICFACFNSCHQNDHLNEAGNVADEAIYSIENDIRRCYGRGLLPIGVWHHNAYGDPYQNDYMRKSVFDKLLEHRIKIGLFGHQHKSQIAEEYSDLLISEENRKRLLLISAGTLFGGDKEQHKAIRRQFNIIELEMTNGRATVKVHVREDGNNDISSDDPFWRAKELPNGVIKYHVEFKAVSDDEIIRRIDDETRTTGNFVNGIVALENSGLSEEQIQPLEDEYLRKLDSKEIISVLNKPKTDFHCLLLISAIDKEHDVKAYRRLRASRALAEALEHDEVVKEQYLALCEKFK